MLSLEGAGMRVVVNGAVHNCPEPKEVRTTGGLRMTVCGCNCQCDRQGDHLVSQNVVTVREVNVVSRRKPPNTWLLND